MASKKGYPKQAVRLCIDFGSPKDMEKFIDQWNWQADDKERVTAYCLDSIDVSHINMNRTFILKHEGDRPEAAKADRRRKNG